MMSWSTYDAKDFTIARATSLFTPALATAMLVGTCNPFG